MQWDHSGSGRDRLWACTEGALHLLDLRGSHPLSIATTHDPAPETHKLAAPLSTQTLLQQASLTTALTQLQQTQQSPSHVLHSVQFHALTCCGVGVSPDGRTVVSGDFTGNLLAWPVAETVRVRPHVAFAFSLLIVYCCRCVCMSLCRLLSRAARRQRTPHIGPRTRSRHSVSVCRSRFDRSAGRRMAPQCWCVLVKRVVPVTSLC